MALLKMTIAILAVYRLARLLPLDDGPFLIFKRIRSFTATRAMMENNEWGFWYMVDEGINCPHCMGIYISLFLVGPLIFLNSYYGNIFLFLMAIAGGQSLLQSLGDK